MQKAINKIKSNLFIYKQDLKTKGLYYSIVHRLYKIPTVKQYFSPIVNSLKPNYIFLEKHKIYIDKSDLVISENLLFSNNWEEYETKLFKKNIKKGDTILDIGAHIGYYTLIAANLVGRKGKVYAFEPDPKNFKLLEKNVKENKYKNVILVNKAVTRSNGKIKLFLSKENTGDHRIYSSDDQRENISIESIYLDDFFKNQNIKINLIKMDIQGAELEALKGGVKTLKKNPNVKIFTEFWPSGLKLNQGSAEEYLKLLASFSLNFYKINEEKEKLTAVTLKDLLKDSFSGEKDYINLFCTS